MLKVVFSVPDAEAMSSNGPSSLSTPEQQKISLGIAVKSMWKSKNKTGTIWRTNNNIIASIAILVFGFILKSWKKLLSEG